MTEVDYVKESKVLLDFIEKMKRGEEIMQAVPAGQQPGAAAAAAPRVRPQCMSAGLVLFGCSSFYGFTGITCFTQIVKLFAPCGQEVVTGLVQRPATALPADITIAHTCVNSCLACCLACEQQLQLADVSVHFY